MGAYYAETSARQRKQVEAREKRRRKEENDRQNAMHAERKAILASGQGGMDDILQGAVEADPLFEDQMDEEMQKLKEEMDAHGEEAEPEPEAEAQADPPEEAPEAMGASGATYSRNPDGTVDVELPRDVLAAQGASLTTSTLPLGSQGQRRLDYLEQENAELYAQIDAKDAAYAALEEGFDQVVPQSDPEAGPLASRLTLALEVIAAQAIAQTHLIEIYEPGRLDKAKAMLQPKDAPPQ